MTVQYQNTFEEFVEASVALAARRKRKSRRFGVLWIVMSGYFFLAALLPGALGVSNRGTLIFHFFAPVVLGGIDVVLVLCVMLLKQGKLPRIGWRGLLSLTPFLFLAAIWVFDVELSRSINPQLFGADWYWKLLAPHTTWLFFLTLFVIMAVRRLRKHRQTLWEQQPSLHRAKSTDISAEGVTISDGVTRYECRWAAFVGWTETKALFVLFPSELQTIFLPKRAFASPEELDAMRALAGLIASSKAGGFPVVHAVSELPPPLPGAG
jgi:hypothetical protein